MTVNADGDVTDITANTIYVGTDGSDMAAEVAVWAAAEAERRGAGLCLVQGYTLVLADFAGEVVYPSGADSTGRDWKDSVLERIKGTVRAAHPDVPVSSKLHYGAAVEVLNRASAHGLLTAVGWRGTHRFLDPILGSEAFTAVTHGSGPVVVVREDPTSGTVRDSGPVLVGLDGMHDSDGALAFACAEASIRGTSLIAVHTWDDLALDRFASGIPLALDRSLIDQEAHRALEAQLASRSQEYPDVSVRSVVLRGSPVATLLNCCADGEFGPPSMLVVGSRGRGGFAGMLLGSTSQALIAHAPCPVVVVRDIATRPAK